MKLFFTRFGKLLISALLIITVNNTAKAQPHAPGDIAFTGYHSFPNDKFSFVLLKAFTAGQTINFTEAGWLPGSNSFDSDEGLIMWTCPAGGLAAGKELTIDCNTNTVTLFGGGAAGTITVTTAIGLNDGGDQIFAFTGTKAAPTSVLAGLHMNTLSIGEIFDPCNTTDATWDNTCATGNNTYSALPSGGGLNTLTGGTNALWIGNIAPNWHEWNNAKFNCASVPAATLSTIAGLRAAVNNKANWIFNDDANPNTTTPLPAGCNWLAAICSVTLSSGGGTNTQTKCINTAITDITYSTTSATGATFSGLPAGVTGGWATNVVTISGTPTASGTFNYTVTLTGGVCAPANTATGTITVTPANTVTLGSAPGTDAQTVSVNSPIANIIYNTAGATGATVSPLPSGVTSSFAANAVTISGSPTAVGTFNYTVTLTGGCGVVTATGSITVNPATCSIILSSAAGTDAQTKCINTAITSITYTTTSATGATFSGLPLGVTGNWAGNVVTISGTPTASGTFNYTVTLTGGVCVGTTATGSITVTVNNTITLSSAPGTNAQTVILTAPMTNISYSTTGATGATFSGLPGGVTGNWAANVVTISGTPTAAGVFNYTVTTTGGCPLATATGTITVNASGPPSALVAGDIAFTGYHGGTASVDSFSFVLLKAVNANTPIKFTDNGWLNPGNFRTGEGDITFNSIALPAGAEIVIGGLTGSLTARWYNYNCSGGVISAGTVTGTALDLNTSGDQIIAYQGTLATPTALISMIHMNTYSTINFDCANTTAAGLDPNCIDGGTGTLGNTLFSKLPTGLTIGTNAIWIGDATVAFPAGEYDNAKFNGCGLNLSTAALARAAINNQTNWIFDNLTPPGFTLPAGCNFLNLCPSACSITLTSATGTDAQTKCINTAITNITYSTTSATGATFAGLPAGVTGSWLNDVVTISGTPTASGTFTYTVTLTGGVCAPANTATGTITVTPANTVTLGSAPGTDAQTVSVNSPIANIIYNTAGATGATVSPLPSGVTSSFAANALTISGSPTAVGTFNYTVTLTGGCGVVTATGSITVNPAACSIILSSAAGTTSQTVCINTAIISITYTTTGATGATFSGLPAGVTGNWAANTVTISGTPTASGISNYTVTLTGGPCTTENTTGTITVTPANTIALTSGNNVQTVILTAPMANITYNTTGATGATFSGLPAGTSGVWAANVVTISGTPTAAGVFNYTVTLTGGCGTITATGTITVNASGPPTALVAGDIAFTGYHAGTALVDSFSFVLLKAINAGTLIKFTDNGWLNPGNFRTGEGDITFTSIALPAGAEIVIGGPAGLTARWFNFNCAAGVISAGTVTGTPLDLNTGGDQIIAYQGTLATPTALISMIHMNTYKTIDFDCGNTVAAGLDPNCIDGGTGTIGNTVFSKLPTGLVIGTNAIWIGDATVAFPLGEYDNAKFNGCGLNLSTAALARAAINNQANWIFDNLTPPGFTLPAGCNFLNLCPVPCSITLSSAAGTDAQSACINSPIINITYSTNTATGANFSGLPAGVTGNWLANVVTISGTPTALGTFNYTVTLTGGACSTTANGTITVNPLPVVSIIPPGPTTICTGGNLALTASGTCTTVAFSGLLSGTNSVPANASTARGVFNGRYNSTTSQLTLTVIFDGLTGGAANAAHIHSGAAGVNGPVIIPFPGFPAAMSGTYTNTFTVSPANAALLMAGNTYINIHNAIFPGGEIRGQITNLVTNGYTISGPLSGTQSVPANASMATGNFAGTYNDVTNQLNINVIFNNLGGGNANAAHIHTGAAGTNGPVIIPFPGFPAAASGGYNLTAAVPAANLAAFMAGNTYVNIHNAVFPGGEIRGQIAPPAAICASNTYLWSPGGATTQSITVSTANTYTVTVTDGNNCSGSASTVVTVNSSPDVNAVPNQYFCGGTSTPVISLTGSVPGTTFNWTNTNTAIGLGASGSGNIPSFVATNATAAPISGTITVTPVIGTCTGTPITFTITVGSTPSITGVTNDNICQPGGVVNLAAAGNGAINWWDAPTGGIVVNTGTTFNPNVTATTTYYVDATTITGPQNLLLEPAQVQTFPGFVRGYWFTAPTNFVITSLSVPTTASSAGQSIAVVKFNGNTPPPVFSATTNAFTTQFLTRNNAAAGSIPCNIPVLAGEVIGFLGYRGTTNSYAAGDYNTTIAGFPVQLQRLGMQFPLTTTDPRDIWRESGAGTFISRIEFEYSAGPNCVSAPRVPVTATVNPLPVVSIIPPGPTTICAGSNLTLTASGTCNGFAFSGLLSGTNSVPANASTARGVFNGRYNSTTSQLTLTVIFDGLTGGAANAAHIHSGAAGVNGPVIIPFPGFPAAMSGTYTNTFTVSPANAALLMAGNTYINIHNAIFPGGEIRGQITNLVTNGYTISGPLSGTQSVPANASMATGNFAGTYNDVTNQLNINVIFNNLGGGNANAAHIHTGAAGTNGPVIIPFPGFPAAASGGYNLTAAVPAANLAAFMAGNTYVNIHNAVFPGGEIRGQIAPPAAICASNTYVWSPGGFTTQSITVSTANTYTVTVTDGNLCSGSASTVVNVNPLPVGSASPQTICSGGTPSVTLNSTTPAGGTTYSYTAAIQTTPTGGTITGQGSGTANPIAQTLTNTGTTFGVIRYTVTPTYTNGGTACTGAPFTVDVTVNPAPVGSATPQTICSGGTTSVTLNANTPAGGTTWSYTASIQTTPTGGTITGQGSGTANPIAQTLTNTGTTFGVIRYTVTPTYTNGGTPCIGATFTVDVTVNPMPNAVATPPSQVICSATPITTIVLTGNVGGTVFNWTRDNTGNVTGIATPGAGNISGTLTNTTTVQQTVTFTITPAYTNGGITCLGTPITATVVVNPTPDVVQPASQVVCNGAPTAPVNFTGSVAGTIFNWTNNTTSIGLAASGTGNIASFNAINTGTAPVVATITVTPVLPLSFTQTFNYTGAIQTWTVPAGVTSVNIDALGAQGGSVTVTCAATGGLGARMKGDFAVTPGEVISILVGQQGLTNGQDAGGGGGTFVVRGASTALLVAGGGGGATNNINNCGANRNGIDASITTSGTASGNGLVAGGTGGNGGGASNGSGGGGGGFLTNGVAGTGLANNNGKSYLNGGTGGFGNNNDFGGFGGGGAGWFTGGNGGGGGGYSGGGTSGAQPFSGGGGGGSFNAGTNQVNTAGVQTGNGQVVLTYLGGPACPGTPKTFTITVNPTATVNAVANQVVCNNTATAAVNFTSPTTGGTIVYNWTNNNPFIGLAGSGTGNIASFIATNANNAPEVATITVTPTYTNGAVSCVGTPITFTITVNPTATVTPVPNQVLCNGANSTPVNFTSPTTGGTIVYNWTNDLPSIGLAASGTGNIPTFVAVNLSAVPVVATVTVTPTYTNGAVSCAGTPLTFTITVNPPPLVNPVPNQVVCNNSPTATINFTTPVSGGVAVFNWTNNTPSIGLAAAGTGDILSFNATNTTNAPVVATITVIMSYTNGGITCVSLPLTFTITVNPTPVVNQPADQVVCSNTATAPVNFTSPTTGGTLVYNWTNNTPSIGLAASGTGNIPGFTALNTGGTVITATILVTASYTNAGVTCTGPSKTFTITVNPRPVIDPVANQVLCNGSPAAAILFTSTVNPSPSLVYNWTNNTPSIGLAASGTGNIASFTATNTGTAPVVATITVTATYANGGVSCTGPSITFTITVNPTPAVNPVANQVVCNGASTAAVNFTSPTTGGTIVYNWSNSNPAIGLGANGVGNIPGFTATNGSILPISGTITVTPTYTNGGISCTGPARTFTITVNPTPTVNQPASQVLCNGSPTTPVNFTGTVAGTVYNWTNTNTSIGLAASGTGNIASFTATNVTNTAQVATITVTPTYTNGGVTCSGTPVSFTITVNPIPTVTLPANQTVCAGSTVTVNFTGTVAGTVFNWANNNPAIGLPASGAGNLNFIATNTGAVPITGTITVTPTYTNGGVTCTGTAVSFTITVNPRPTVNQAASQVLCNGSPTAAVTFSGSVTGTVFNWTNNTPSIGLAAAGTGNIASFTATNITNAPVVATITVTPTFTAGGVTCTGPTMSFTITVNPTPSVNAIANQVVCNRATTAAVTITGPVAGTVYNWTTNNTSIGLVPSGTNTVPAFIALNNTNAPVTATITVIPTYTNAGVSCTGIAISFTITVNPTPTVSQPGDQLLCNGSATAAINFTGTVAGTVYSWTNNTTSIGLAASGTGNIASFTAINTTNAPVTATITVTPSAASCVGTPVSFTITVNPTPTVNQPANQTVCAGSSTAAVVFTGATAGTIFTWTNNNTTIGLGAGGTGNIPAFVTINPTILPVTATITVTPTYSNGGLSCTGATLSFTITVNPQPNIIFTNVPPRVCLTDTLVALGATPVGGTWSGSGVTGSTFSASAAGPGVKTLGYTVTNANGCTATSFVNVTVNDCIDRHNVFATAIRIYPNPSSGLFNIRFLSDIYTEFNVRVVDGSGREYNTYHFTNLHYGSVIPMDLRRLAGGTYWLQIYNASERAHFPFVIVR